jgi:hypothetical protein
MPVILALGLHSENLSQKKKKKKKQGLRWAQVAHACDPSYSGSRDQEDLGSKPAWANSLRIYLTQKQKNPKHPSQKKGWWRGSRCRP